jgi:predicted enzyme related to lactoylglutathione lyase
VLQLVEVILYEIRRASTPKFIALPIIFAAGAGQVEQGMAQCVRNPVVHLELRTGNLARACAFYSRLFGWGAETVHTGSGDYVTLGLGGRIEGGVVEHETGRPFWLPYVEVTDVVEAVERARLLGATVLLPPREGPAGWRSILAVAGGGEIALWQPKA